MLYNTDNETGSKKRAESIGLNNVIGFFIFLALNGTGSLKSYIFLARKGTGSNVHNKKRGGS